MIIVLTIICILLAALSGYSIYCLKVLREEIKAKNHLLRVYKTYHGEVRLP
jgi:hypothetical protein